MADYALKLKGLTKRYDGFTLDHVSFALPMGCIHGIYRRKRGGEEHNS